MPRSKPAKAAKPTKDEKLPGVVPQRLKEARVDAKLTQQELAHRVGMSQGALSEGEYGSGRDFRISTVIRIADVLNVSVDWLTGRTN